jgi:gluconolactonase
MNASRRWLFVWSLSVAMACNGKDGSVGSPMDAPGTGGAGGQANGGSTAPSAGNAGTTPLVASGGSGGSVNPGGRSGNGGPRDASTVFDAIAPGSTDASYPGLTDAMVGSPEIIPVSTPLTLAESPLWDPCHRRWLFADVTNSLIYSLSSDDALTVFASGTGDANGIAFDLDGSLLLAQMARPGHIARLDASGTITPIDPPGPALHTPDDLAVRSDGTVYFTDGSFEPTGSVMLQPLPIYAFKPGVSTGLASIGSVSGPNGIEFSPDEQTLYVSAFHAGAIVKFTATPDGSFTKGPLFATGLKSPDSLCLDVAGNVYIGVTAGLQVLAPDGTRIALLKIPGVKATTNCAFGGDDGRTLFITAWTQILRVRDMPIPGLDWKTNRKRLSCM